jgi:hypothetical protein
MIKYSKEIVEKYSYKEITPSIYKIYLRENISKKNDDLYLYNEYSILISSSKENIINDIETNFDSYIERAKVEEALENKEKEKENLKQSLTNTDYQVIKCAESYMLGSVLPYDFSQLLSSRTDIRNKINILESDEELSEEDALLEEKNKKITEMCAICQTTITNGIDVNDEHYRLNTTDQINLTSLYSLAQLGQSVPYHADGKVCKIFTPEEMITLVQTATAWITYHTTYYNLLKNQINEMETVEEVNNVYYGMTLKDEYQAIINLITASSNN